MTLESLREQWNRFECPSEEYVAALEAENERLRKALGSYSYAHSFGTVSIDNLKHLVAVHLDNVVAQQLVKQAAGKLAMFEWAGIRTKRARGALAELADDVAELRREKLRTGNWEESTDV